MKVRVAWPRSLVESLYHERRRYLVLMGGRSSGKSMTAALIVLVRGMVERHRVLCVREYQSSMDESVLPLMMELNETYGLGYHRKRGKLVHAGSGTEIMFHGLSGSTGTAASIRSMQGVTLVWAEEAQFLSRVAWDTLTPTIRAEGSRFVATMNPHKRDDPVYQLAVSGRDDVRCEHVNWDRNTLLTQTMREEIAQAKATWPQEWFDHHYGGQLLDDAGVQRVIPRAWLDACVELWDPAHADGHAWQGWDVGELGNLANATVLRRGPVVLAADVWAAKTWTAAADRVARAHVAESCRLTYLDKTGVGSGAVSALEARTSHLVQSWPFGFGDAVAGKERRFIEGASNAAYFYSRGPQAWWALRLRAQNTWRLAQGEDVDPAVCLFVARDVRNIPGLILELSQPVWMEGPDGRIKVDKLGGDKANPSPHRADATVLAYAWDSRRGLTESDWTR